jgi:hypothetical protein
MLFYIKQDVYYASQIWFKHAQRKFLLLLHTEYTTPWKSKKGKPKKTRYGSSKHKENFIAFTYWIYNTMTSKDCCSCNLAELLVGCTAGDAHDICSCKLHFISLCLMHAEPLVGWTAGDAHNICSSKLPLIAFDYCMWVQGQ